MQRRLEDVEHAVNDEHAGLIQALRPVLEVDHQRCQVHYMRNARWYVSTDTVRVELRTLLRDAWAGPARRHMPALARLTAREADAEGAPRPPTGSRPAGVHCLRLRSTSNVEHDHAEIHRRTRGSALTIERDE